MTSARAVHDPSESNPLERVTEAERRLLGMLRSPNRRVDVTVSEHGHPPESIKLEPETVDMLLLVLEHRREGGLVQMTRLDEELTPQRLGSVSTTTFANRDSR